MRASTWMPLTALTCVVVMPWAVDAHAATWISAEVGMVSFDFDDEPRWEAQVGMRFAGGPVHAPRMELAVAMLPEALAEGAIFEMAELGLAIPVPLGERMSLALSVGGAQMGIAAGGWGGGVAFGVYGRAALSAEVSDGVSLDLGYTQRQYSSEGDGFGLGSVTGAITWHGSPSRAREDGGDYVGTGRLEKRRPKR